MKAIELIVGKKYGKLTVIKRVKSGSRGQARWLCECDCGIKTTKDGAQIASSHTKSCGCLYKFPPTVASFKKFYEGYQRHADRRGLSFFLSKDKFREITSQNCHYCNELPKPVSGRKQNNGIYIGNGIDRVDNKKGYTIDNCVSCCIICNYAKRSMTVGEFRAWVKRIHKHFVEGNK